MSSIYLFNHIDPAPGQLQAIVVIGINPREAAKQIAERYVDSAWALDSTLIRWTYLGEARRGLNGPVLEKFK